MRLYLVRQARSQGETTELETLQGGLSARGVAQAQHAAMSLQALEGVEHHLNQGPCVLTSGAPEVLETARIIASRLGCEAMVRDELSPGKNVGSAIDLLHECAHLPMVVIVGMNPQIGELLSVLASGPGARGLTIASGEMVALELRATQPIGTGRIKARALLEEVSRSAEDRGRSAA